MTTYRLVVLGDTLLDVDIEGITERRCPDAPVPVVDVRRRRVRPGGAGLAAILAARAGHDVTLISAIGPDERGGLLSRLLADTVRVEPMRLCGTTVAKSRVIIGDQPFVRIDSGDGRAGAETPPRHVLDTLRDADGVLVADYGRGITGNRALRAVLADGRVDRPLVWDPHPRGSPPVEHAWLVTPNRAEAELFSDSRPPDAEALRAAWRAHAVAVTVGASGAVLATDDHRATTAVDVPPELVAPPGTDTCGAGDSFAVGAVTALLNGADPTEAVCHAVRTAARFVAMGGARALGMVAEPAPAVHTTTTGLDVVDRVRQRGGTVVATGGCFDLLHPGHVSLLREARSLGDALVVCVNSDESVARRKGAGRPIIPLADRVRMLEALQAVDAVAVFTEDCPAALVRRLRPDVWVKGTDYTDQRMPEAEVVTGYGGRVVLVALTEGYSTSRLVDTIHDRTHRRTTREGAA